MTKTPTLLIGTCIDCEDIREFVFTEGSEDELIALYRCRECGHKVRIDLDASDGP